MKHFTLLFLLLLGSLLSAQAQGDTSQVDNKKTGWSFGAIPVVAYDTDVGFKYGALTNLYYFGDGSTYPDYLHSIYLEWSRTTKGSGINEFMIESRSLIPGLRTLIDVNYLTEQTLDFYGFNGYQADYNSVFSDQDNPTDYITRVYYRHERKQLKMTADFQGKLKGDEIRWLGGYGYYGNQINPVDVAKLNSKSKPEEVLLPENTNTLLENYLDWGIIPQDQIGKVPAHQFRGGIVYDLRDNEANPQKGVWTELLLTAAPFGNYKYLLSTLTHRQYFTLVPRRLTFAYRLIYQQKLAGDIPFFMLPYYYNSKQNKDGFGGAKTIRGVFRNRVVGDGVAVGNFEARFIPLRTVILKQNFYIGLSAFMDAGTVTSPYKINTSQIPAGVSLGAEKDGLHIGYGGGIRFALNDNFIIAVDYGRAADPQDGSSGMYIGLNWLF